MSEESGILCISVLPENKMDGSLREKGMIAPV
jgi:hypothetical protein